MEHLKIGLEPDFAPLTYQSDDRAKGLIVDILASAAEIVSVETEFLPVDLPDQDAALRDGAVDALAFKAIIPDRTDAFDFSVPLTISGAAWFTSDGAQLENGTRPVPGTRVATPVRGPLSAQIRRDFPDVSVVDVDTYEVALNAVRDNNAEIAALNFHVGCYLVHRDHAGGIQIPAEPYQQIPIGLAVASGRHKLALAAINQSVTQMRRDGTLADMERRWLSGA